MIKKIAAVLTPLLLALGMVAMTAAPANAHTGDLNASAECLSDGTFEVTYTLTISNTALAGSTMWRTGTTTFEGTPGSNAGLTNGPVASTGAGDYVLGSIILPGNSTQAPWAYAYTTWSDQYAKGSDGGDIELDGDCVAPPEVAKVDWGLTPPTCTTGQILTIGNNNLTGAVWTEASLAYNGIEGANEFDIVATLLDGYVWGDGVTGTFHIVLAGPDLVQCGPQPPDETYTTHSDGVPNCTSDTVLVTTYYWKITYLLIEGVWVAQPPYQYLAPTAANRPLTDDEVVANCVITDVPVATYKDECGPDNGVLTLTPPTSAAWAWGEPAYADGKVIVQAIPVGVYEFGKDVKTTFEFEVNDAACPIPSITLPNTGVTVPIWPLGLGGVLLLGAGGALALNRRKG